MTSLSLRKTLLPSTRGCRPFSWTRHIRPGCRTWYPLSHVLSLISTGPPKPVSELRAPTMFVVASGGPTPKYIKALYDDLPHIRKSSQLWTEVSTGCSLTQSKRQRSSVVGLMKLFAQCRADERTAAGV